MRTRWFLAALSAVLAASALTFPSLGAGARPRPQPLPTGRIAFSSDRVGGINAGSDIYIVNPDGTGLARLTNFNKYSFQPTWSPDGTRIAFAGVLPGRGSRYGPHDIYVMDADGGDVTRITGGTLQHVAPAWSPDGSTIAFVQKPGPTVQPQPAHIALMNPDGTGIVEITSGPDFDYRPTWSPDGSQIAFERDFHNGTTAIHIVNRDGTGLTRLLDGVCCLDPAWSPDGARISFWDSELPGLRVLEIASGKVTTLALAEELGSGQTFDRFSSWSPDGRWLALAACCDGSGEVALFVISADGRTTLQVPNGQFAMAPAWQPA